MTTASTSRGNWKNVRTLLVTIRVSNRHSRRHRGLAHRRSARAGGVRPHTRQSDVARLRRTKSWCRRSSRATSSCSTTWPCTSSRRCKSPSNASAPGCAFSRLQSGFQSDRARVCEAESLPARRSTAHLRPDRRPRRPGASAAHAAGMPQLRAALRLPPRYRLMKNGLISAARRESEALPWIRGRPFADQSANVCWHTWSPGASAAFPGPEQAKVTSMPGDDGLRLDDMKRRPPGAPGSREPRPQHPVCRSQTKS